MNFIDPHYVRDNQKLVGADSNNIRVFILPTPNKKQKWIQVTYLDFSTLKKVAYHSALAISNERGLKPEDLKRFGGLYADFDCQADPLKAIEQCQNLIRLLITKYKVPPESIIVFVSGAKGSGFYVDSRVFGDKCTTGHPLLAVAYRFLLEKIAPLDDSNYSCLDRAIYSLKRGRLQRAINIMRDNGFFRANVPIDFFISSSAIEIEKLKNKPGPKVAYPIELLPSPKLQTLFEEALDLAIKCKGKTPKAVKAKQNAVIPASSGQATSGVLPSNTFPCVELVNEGPSLYIQPGVSFNSLAFNFGSLYFDNPEHALAELRPFLEKRNSNSYPTCNERSEHLITQIHAAKKTNASGKFCNAIRKSLSKFTCMDCDLFKLFPESLNRDFEITKHGTMKLCETNSIVMTNAYVQFYQKRKVLDEKFKPTSIEFTFLIHLPKFQSFQIAIQNDELHDTKTLLNKISLATDGAAVFDPKKVVDVFATSRMTEPVLPSETIFLKTGFYGNKLVFPRVIITPEQVLSLPAESSSTFVQIDSSKTLTKFHLTETNAELAASIIASYVGKVETVFDSKIFFILLAFSFVPIIAGYSGIDNWFFLELVGSTGDGKTLCIRTALASLGDFWGRGDLPSAVTTPNRLEIEGSYFRHLPFVIDDVKRANVPNMPQLRRILQSAADGSGRGRLNADSTLQGDAPTISGHTVLSAEESVVGTEASLIGRGITIEFPKSQLDLGFVAEMRARSTEWNSWGIGFLQDILNSETPENLLQKFNCDVKFFSDQMSEGENRIRVCQSLGQIKMVLSLLINYFEKIGAITKSQASQYFEQTTQELITIGKKQVLTAKENLSGEILLDTLRNLLQAQKVSIIDELGIEDKFGSVIGYRSKDFVRTKLIYLIPTAAVGVVKDHLFHVGSALDFGVIAISKSLDRSGYLKDKDIDRNTKKIRVNGKASDFWVLSADDLFGPDVPVDYPHPKNHSHELNENNSTEGDQYEFPLD